MTAALRISPDAGPAQRTLLDELRFGMAATVIPRRRSMREFACQELVLPKGPYQGRRFRTERQPWSALLLDQIDSGLFNEFDIVGPVQSGKTLSGWVLPICYHLFEIGEAVIAGLPDKDMAGDKWKSDLLPVIKASQYRRFLPSTGGGSRGGKVDTLYFTNGAELKFMSGHGGDEERSHFTARVVVITETDKMDVAGEASRESDPISQLKGRTRAYGDRRRIYRECSASIARGRIWTGYQAGTASVIVVPCVHCAAWISPGRDDLVGWQEATSEREAHERAHFACPECEHAISEDDRRHCNERARLVHKGQTIDAHGVVHGPVPPTFNLGFRWSAFNNLFVSAGDVGLDEWKALRSDDEENAKKELNQFVWAVPYDPPEVDLSALDPHGICSRVTNTPRGVIPAGAEFCTVGVDVGQYLCHWELKAWRPGATPHTVDYGTLEVPQAGGFEKGVLLALRMFRDELVEPGWPVGSASSAVRMSPRQVWVDAGWQGRRQEPDFVYQFCAESSPDVAAARYRPCKGFGANQYAGEHYRAPLKVDDRVRKVGDHWHIARLKREGGAAAVFVAEFSADHWKSWWHSRLRTARGEPGAATLFHVASPHEHLAIARHWTAEIKKEEFKPGVGMILRWHRVNRNNHWLDCSSIACAAASFCGAKLLEQPRPRSHEATKPRSPLVTRPDGRAWLATER